VTRRRRPGGRGQQLRLGEGSLRGRRLPVPAGVRPSVGRVREALWSIWRRRIAGSSFLDLYAGSGAVGLEALALGASLVVLVEGRTTVTRPLRHNLDRLAPAGRWRLERGRLPEHLGTMAGAGERFDLVFADPPYAFARYEELLVGVAAVLAAGGELAVEHSTRRGLPETAGGLERTDVRRYGESGLAFFRYPEGDRPEPYE
jgi:16S rRNA (guanine966-N2)-methyltransferase